MDRLQGLSGSVDEAHDGIALEFGLRRCIGPDLLWPINRDVVPYNTGPVMFSHRVGENSISIPILRNPRIMNAPESNRRGRRQVRGQHRVPNYEYTKMRVACRLQ